MTPSLPGESELLEAAAALLALLEARGEYYYDEINVKRWVTDGDACEVCEDNADMGWIGDEDVFDSVFGVADGPPAHPHCYCSLEYGTKRKRVYV